MFSIRLRHLLVPKTSTSGTSDSRYSTRWEPANPVIPVISTRIDFLLLANEPCQMGWESFMVSEPGVESGSRTTTQIQKRPDIPQGHGKTEFPILSRQGLPVLELESQTETLREVLENIALTLQQ